VKDAPVKPESESFLLYFNRMSSLSGLTGESMAPPLRPVKLTLPAAGTTLAAMETVHATALDVGGKGVLLRGASGSGKSDLALRLIDTGALLVADDCVILSRRGGEVVAMAPERIAGRMEVRGLGIVRMPVSGPSPVRLVVDLVPPEAVERLPKAAETMLLGVAIPLMNLAPFETSAPAKLRLALRLAPREIER
jgi:hypothetical protein